MKKQVNICFATDNNYAQHTAVAMTSILKNTAHPSNIRFYIMGDDIGDENCKKLKLTVEQFGSTVQFIKLSNENLAQGFVSGQISRTCYFRLDIPNVLSKEIKKIIYLDGDLLVYDDIINMWNTDMQGKPLAAVCDLGIMASKRKRREKLEKVGLATKEPYFNSGVMIMDLELWRQEHYAEKVIKLALENNFPNHDQDALNKIFSGNWFQLPLNWNVIPPVFELLPKILLNSAYREQAIKARENPAIFHYAGGYKPWEYKIYQKFNEQYYKYLQFTAFKKVIMPQFDSRRKHRSIRRQVMRLKLADFWQKLLK
ncbi:MAG: glycosyltransferase family 8 protein [Acidaminococcaceae bacterium]